MSRRAVALALLALTVAAAPAQAARVRSGPLTARTADSPWGLSFSQRGGVGLTQSSGTGPGPSGTLGFRDAGGWRHATRVMSQRRRGRSLFARLATNDPRGRPLLVAVKPGRSGELVLSAELPRGSAQGVQAMGVGFATRGGERYLGFGERSNAVDQRGGTVENYVGEGPYLPGEARLVSAIVPTWSLHDRRDASYFPMPWLLSDRGYGVLLDNSETSYFRLGSDEPGTWSVEAQSNRLVMRVFAGPRPADVLQRLTRQTGRQPKPAAPWFLGPWFQTGQPSKVPPADERRWAGLLRSGDAPVSVAETHMRFLPCGSQQGNEQFERDRTSFFHSRGFASLTYFQEKVCKDYTRGYRQGLERDAFLKRPSGQVYEFDAFVGDRNPPRTRMGQIDFSAPGAEGFYHSLLQEAADLGHDGWMEDFGEAIPPDSKAANGMSGQRFHNLYPVLYHRAGQRFADRAAKPIARFSRSGWTGAHRYSPIVWGGDPTTTWGFDGLESSIKNGLTMGLSGIGIWGSDIGGYFTLPGAPKLTPELLIRWIQFGSVSGAMRTKATGQAIPNYERPQIWEPQIIPHWRRYAKLRTQLYPYLAASEAKYRETGLPLMRHLSLAYPRDRVARGLEDQYLFGADLLAAPVVRPDARTRELYLPEGRWVDFWRAVRYDDRRGGLELGSARATRGQRRVTVPAPLEQLPLFARAGSLFALLPPDVDTLTSYGNERGLVHLGDRRRRMQLLLFPRGRTSRSFGYGERLSSSEGRDSWRLAVRGRRTRVYSLQASLGTLRRSLRPCSITLNGRRLSRGAWSFDGESRALRARFRTRRGQLVVRACR